ncbi:hypothetical protein [Enterobacter asburiae]|uniref:hypothetical protein n=1 Tax=Enterobacter asburiae TaxID=61645 RepID=UPI0021CE7A36|nr:hypothetical protein [Enterobacter asburiae]MCU6244202.1 hypothetical protein [Enterobacter asburiae]
MSFFAVASSSLTDDVLMLFLMLAGTLLAAFLGQSVGYPRGSSGSGPVLAVIVCLSGLLTGCAFYISVVGFAAREKAQTHEVQAVGRAWQYSGLLSEPDRGRARQVLRGYLDERIRFYRENTSAGLRTWGRLARDSQSKLWVLAEGNIFNHGCMNTLALLNVYSGLGDAMTQTRSVWRRQLPDAAWWMLISSALSLCYLSGYQLAGNKNAWRTLLFVPVLMALALFVIAEIDLPGQGIIHVTPDGLESLAEELQTYNAA